MKIIFKSSTTSDLVRNAKKIMKLRMIQRIIEFALKDLFKSLIKEAFS
jgi:hypothetical protein